MLPAVTTVIQDRTDNNSTPSLTIILIVIIAGLTLLLVTVLLAVILVKCLKRKKIPNTPAQIDTEGVYSTIQELCTNFTNEAQIHHSHADECGEEMNVVENDAYDSIIIKSESTEEEAQCHIYEETM